MDRDARLDPRPGDVVTSADGREQAVVLRFIESCDPDPELGPPPYVEARIDERSGQRTRSTMSLATWRRWSGSDPFVEFGPVARERIGMQAQYASRYILGLHGAARLGDGLRFRGRPDDYHFIKIHTDDVEEFVRRVNEHRRATGQIRP